MPEALVDAIATTGSLGMPRETESSGFDVDLRHLPQNIWREIGGMRVAPTIMPAMIPAAFPIPQFVHWREPKWTQE